jgi:hypothetical protein
VPSADEERIYLKKDPMIKVRQASLIVVDAMSYICLAYPFGVAFYAVSRYDKCHPNLPVISSVWWIYLAVANIPLMIGALIWLSIRIVLADGSGWYARVRTYGPYVFLAAMIGITGIIVIYLKLSPPCVISVPMKGVSHG